jgi:hypothetical protein
MKETRDAETLRLGREKLLNVALVLREVKDACREAFGAVPLDLLDEFNTALDDICDARSDIVNISKAAYFSRKNAGGAK